MHVLFTASQLALLALPAIATFGGHGHHGADGKHSDSADAGVSSGSKSTSVSASGSFEFEEKFTSGSIAGSWIQMAGAQHEDSLVFQQGGGIALTLRESEAQSTNIVSKLQFSAGSHIEFTLKTNSKTGCMSSVTLWPAGNVGGNGEIDLELLGGNDNDIIQCPIWAPGQSTPIDFATKFAGWGYNKGGPVVDFFSSIATSVAHWLSVPSFDMTAENRFACDITEDTIEWSVNGNKYASFKKGSDEKLWPLASGEPFVISMGIWANTTLSSWMGRYEYDAASPPSMVISDFKFSGACTNPEEVENGKSEDDSAGSISTETAEDSVGASESGDLSLGFSGSGNLGSGGAVITGDVSGTPTSIGGVSSVSSQAGGSATPTKGKDCDVSGVPVKGSQPAATDYNPGFVAGPTATNSDEAPPKPQKTGDDSNDDGEIEEGTGSSGSGSLKGGCGCDNDSPSSGGDSDEEQDDSPDGSDTGTASEDATSSLGDSAIGSGEDVSGEDDSGSEVASPSLTASSGFSSVVASKGSVSEGTEPEVSSDNAEPSTLDVVIPDSSSSKMSSSMALVVFSALAIYFRV